jgi:hypothetical protein
MDVASDKLDTVADDKDASASHAPAKGKAADKLSYRKPRLPKTEPQVSLYRILLDVEVRQS